MSPLALSLQFLQAQSDRRLVELAREGHEPAFEALVRRYRKELLAYCRRLQPRSASAEDVLQQTLLQAWKALKAGAEIREARPWLYRIAHNVTVSHLRVAAAMPQDIHESSGGPEVHQLVEQRLRARAALAGVAALPELQRDVFVSATLDGASHEEVASALGLSSGAVRGLIYRARAAVRAAAAAFIPSPALHWAIRRAQSQGAGARTAEAVGGGGAGVAAMIVKGSAVLTVAGALAGAGGVILTQRTTHHRRAAAPSPSASRQADPQPSHVRFAAARPRTLKSFVLALPGRAPEPRASAPARKDASGERRDFRAGRDDHGTAGGTSALDDGGRSGAGLSTTSTDGRDGSATQPVTTTGSDGGGGSGASDGSGGGSDGGGGGGSGDGSTSTTSGSGAGTGSDVPGPSIGEVASVDGTSGPDSGSDGGGPGDSGASSGSGDTTTSSGSP
jgi:RNA polymerase sigma factor (sigma-70 family)